MKKINFIIFLLLAFDVAVFAESVKINVDMVKIPGTNIEILKTEVTQTLYESVMGMNPSHFIGEKNPVENVSMYDAIYFCNKLSVLNELTPVYAVDGETDVSKWDYEPNCNVNSCPEIKGEIIQKAYANGYRLPTMNEWINSARGGKSYKYAGSNRINTVAWYQKNSGYHTHPVAKKRPNDYGLFDMTGNVGEWLWEKADTYRWYYIGGSWNDYLCERCENEFPSSTFPEFHDFDIGFRIVRKAIY